jgi:putative peptide zinc metalloprotease protein
MATLADSLVSATSRPLKLRMRADLTVRSHRYHGQLFWIVKEPIALNYFRFHEEEFAVLKMLDGNTSLDTIKEEFERRFAPQKITFGDLQQFVGMLHRNGLVVSQSSGQGKQLKKRRDEKVWKELLSKLANVFALRFRGIDPDRLLTWLHRYTGWFFTTPMVVFNLLFGLSALMLVLINYDTFQAKLPTFHQFFGLKNWIFLAITMGTVKVLHEFGHGLSCKHFGGECHEMGAMLLVFTPALYCNVSDSWLLPNKWHRAAIGAAGMYVELFLASCAVYLWWFSQPGLFNYLCLSVIFICSVSTVMFNGNPLMRFDGYYILMDLAEIPNLRQKATEVLKRYLTHLCLGIEQPESPFLPKENQLIFGLYTIGSEIYRLFVVFSILFFLNSVFEPYGLKIIGQVIGFAGVFGLVVQPLWQLIQFFRTPGRSGKVKKARVAISLAVAAAVIVAVAMIPLPFSVSCPFEVVPRNAAPVYVAVPGRMDAGPNVELLSHVKKGDQLVQLTNLELELEVERLQGEYNAAKDHLDTLERAANKSTQLEGQIPSSKALEEARRLLLERKLEELAKLSIVAPRDGIVLPAPRKAPMKDPRMLPSWSGSVFDEKNRGSFLKNEDVVCVIGSPEDLEAVLVYDQIDVNLIKPDVPVALMFEANVDRVYHGKIDTVAKVALEHPSPNLMESTGGYLAAKADKTGNQKLISTSYQARVPLAEAISGDHTLIYLGQRGQARVYTGWQSLGERLVRFVYRTFHFHL